VLHVHLFFSCLDGDDVFEGDDLGGSFIDSAFLEGEEVVVGEDYPAPKIKKRILSPAFEETRLFMKVALSMNILHFFEDVGLIHEQQTLFI